MCEALYIGVDIGTTVIKVTVVNEKGDIIYQNKIFGNFHNNAFVHDPEVVWEKFLYVTKKMLASLGIKSIAVQSIAITGMIPNLYLLGSNGKPLEAMLYFDPRAIVIERDLNKELQTPRWQNEVLSKVIWLKRYRSKEWKKTRVVLTTHAYLVYKLTGQCFVDTITALESGNVFDPNMMTWNFNLFEKYGIRKDIFPPIVPPGKIVGSISDDASRITGLPKTTRVIMGTADTIGSFLGAGLQYEGDLMIYYGTYNCAALLLHDIEDALLKKEISNPIEWVASIPRAGQQLSHIAQQLFPSHSLEDALALVDKLAMKSVPGARGVTFVQTFDLASASDSTEPKAAIFGISLDNTIEDICRALLEAFGYGLKYSFEHLCHHEIKPRKVFAAGGGAKSPVWRQIISDITGFTQYYFSEAGYALGAAMLAALPIHRDVYLRVRERQSNRFEITVPIDDNRARYDLGYKRYSNYLNLYSSRSY